MVRPAGGQSIRAWCVEPRKECLAREAPGKAAVGQWAGRSLEGGDHLPTESAKGGTPVASNKTDRDGVQTSLNPVGLDSSPIRHSSLLGPLQGNAGRDPPPDAWSEPGLGSSILGRGCSYPWSETSPD
jgi:hypothetical protein